ncbi:small ribosomal subunit protein mS27 [Chironomus tepperi]|uniref:small ribosomal subunit protein mS27 n=1 Tax=Chironomus tepperi TaxID=113505 RepID=UPI00391F85CA
MWRNIIRFSRGSNNIIKRTYLSDGYKLDQEWSQRLTTSILQKINSENLYVDLSSKFQQKKKITAIDVDIYMNKADERNVEEAADLLQKLRLTSQAHKILDSSQHAFIRLAQHHTETLFSVLNSRLDYGVFLDNYTANLLMDSFIKEKNFMLAARVATIQMLQEDMTHPITRYLSLYSCYKFSDNLETFTDLIPPAPVEVEKVAQPVSKKKKEEIRKRVGYLRNPYNDDHFDLTNTNHLVGKTFLYLADEIKKDDEALANSFSLLGYALYEKYEEGSQFLEKSKQLPVYKEVLEKISTFGSKVENLDENGQKFYDNVKSLSNQKDGKVDEVIENFVKKAVSENESKDIEEQKKTFQKWLELREQTLNNEINRLKRIQRLEDIEKLQEEMDKQEQKLWFFENIENIKLDIEDKKVFHPQRWFGKKKKPKKLDENYVPPDVESITRARRAK